MTIAQSPMSYKPRKAYFAHLDEEPGMLFQRPGGAIVFQAERTDVITTITPEMVPFLTVLGEMTTANTQLRDDGERHGYPAIACSR